MSYIKTLLSNSTPILEEAPHDIAAHHEEMVNTILFELESDRERIETEISALEERLDQIRTAIAAYGRASDRFADRRRDSTLAAVQEEPWGARQLAADGVRPVRLPKAGNNLGHIFDESFDPPAAQEGTAVAGTAREGVRS